MSAATEWAKRSKAAKSCSRTLSRIAAEYDFEGNATERDKKLDDATWWQQRSDMWAAKAKDARKEAKT